MLMPDKEAARKYSFTDIGKGKSQRWKQKCFLRWLSFY